MLMSNNNNNHEVKWSFCNLSFLLLRNDKCVLTFVLMCHFVKMRFREMLIISFLFSPSSCDTNNTMQHRHSMNIVPETFMTHKPEMKTRRTFLIPLKVPSNFNPYPWLKKVSLCWQMLMCHQQQHLHLRPVLLHQHQHRLHHQHHVTITSTIISSTLSQSMAFLVILRFLDTQITSMNWLKIWNLVIGRTNLLKIGQVKMFGIGSFLGQEIEEWMLKKSSLLHTLIWQDHSWSKWPGMTLLTWIQSMEHISLRHYNLSAINSEIFAPILFLQMEVLQQLLLLQFHLLLHQLSLEWFLVMAMLPQIQFLHQTATTQTTMILTTTSQLFLPSIFFVHLVLIWKDREAVLDQVR